MKFGIIGLGKMGSAIAYRVLKGGFEVFGFDLDKKATEAAQKMGVKIVDSIEHMPKYVRVIWLMVPVGSPVDDTLKKLLPHLQKGDIVIDGGNSKYTDSIRRAKMLEAHGVEYLDCGTSGGIEGKETGFSLMVGGNVRAYEKVKPFWQCIAAPQGFGLVGPTGAGHYVKMIHNGIEYGLLEAYAEGFHVLHDGSYKDLNLQQISGIWNHGSVIRSFLLQLAQKVFKEHPDFKNISGEIAEGGTGLWTVESAKENKIPVPVIEESLKIRKWSRETGGNWATKLIALLRQAFGGHEVKKIKD